METDTNKHVTITQMRYRLERNHNKLQSLILKLNSYKCEPKSYNCFERLYNIQDDIRTFKKQHSKLHAEFSTGQYESQESLGKLMREQVMGFKELEDKISKYLLYVSGN